MNPQQFEQCFEQWVNQLVNELGIQVFAIDGKNLRGSDDRESGAKALHLVSAWATEHRLVLAQSQVQDKSNEITAIPALLELLDIKGCIVTLEAMGTQKTIAAQIQQAQADYILCLKANHPNLFQEIDTWFQVAHAAGTLPIPQHTPPKQVIIALNCARCGRFRSTNCLPCISQRHGWDCKRLSSSSALAIFGIKLPTKFSFTLAVYLPIVPELPLPFVNIGALKIPCIGRFLVTFGEDACRVRSLHAPHNLALLRRFAVNTLNRESTGKRSLKQKSKRAAKHRDRNNYTAF